MKKLIKLLLIVAILITTVSCSSLRKMLGAQNVAKYNDIRATFVTTQARLLHSRSFLRAVLLPVYVVLRR